MTEAYGRHVRMPKHKAGLGAIIAHDRALSAQNEGFRYDETAAG
jgi:hypothetical protein